NVNREDAVSAGRQISEVAVEKRIAEIVEIGRGPPANLARREWIGNIDTDHTAGAAGRLAEVPDRKSQIPAQLRLAHIHANIHLGDSAGRGFVRNIEHLQPGAVAIEGV